MRAQTNTQITFPDIAFLPDNNGVIEQYAQLANPSPGLKDLTIRCAYSLMTNVPPVGDIYLDIDVELENGQERYSSDLIWTPTSGTGRVALAQFQFISDAPFVFIKIRLGRLSLEKHDTYDGDLVVHALDFELTDTLRTPLQELAERTWAEHDDTDPPVVFDFVPDPSVRKACP